MSYRNKADEVAYQRDRAHGRARYVSADPVRRKLQQLLDADVPVRALSRSSGLSAPALQAIVDGDRTRVQRRTAARVANLTLTGIYEQRQSGHVPKIGAVRRLQALMAMGWTKDHITEAGATSLPRVLSGPGNLITLDKWREIKNVYDQLSMTPGPSPQTKNRAHNRGYARPLAWDDGMLDDPHARPQAAVPAAAGAETIDMVAVDRAIARAGSATQLTPAERVEVVRSMAAGGASDRQIGQHLDVVDRTILRTRQRNDIPTTLRPPPTRDETDWDYLEARHRGGHRTAGLRPSTTTHARAASRRTDPNTTMSQVHMPERASMIDQQAEDAPTAVGGVTLVDPLAGRAHLHIANTEHYLERASYYLEGAERALQHRQDDLSPEVAAGWSLSVGTRSCTWSSAIAARSRTPPPTWIGPTPVCEMPIAMPWR